MYLAEWVGGVGVRGLNSKTCDSRSKLRPGRLSKKVPTHSCCVLSTACFKSTLNFWNQDRNGPIGSEPPKEDEEKQEE